MAISKEDIITISRTVIETLESRRSVPEERHHDDHTWLKDFRRKAEHKAAMWRKIKVQAIGWFIVAAVGGLASGLWWLVTESWALVHK